MGASEHLVTTTEQLEALYGEKKPASVIKEIDRINCSYRKLIEAAPFVAVATGGPEGLDCSPKGRARLRAHPRRQDGRHSGSPRQQPH